MCMVREVQKDGVIVVGYDRESKPFYYNEITRKYEELITWSKAYSLNVVDEDRLGEVGYIR